ncbi:MAG: hypothetical protein Kow0022_11080 [Phycisphaerales bacterium]
MNILVADKLESECIQGLQNLGCSVHVDPELGPDTLGEAIRKTEAEILVVRSTKVPGAVLEGATTLRGIVRAGAGVDNIDVAAATRAGIAVSNCPGMNSAAVAELTMGLLIACDRRIPQQTAELKAGHWNKREYSKARGLLGATMLVIGRGAIGRQVVRRAKAFGMHLLIEEPSLTPQWAAEIGLELIGSTKEDLHRALERSDAVTIHVPLTDTTRGMCNAEFFSHMKRGAIFINTSRGPIVDEAALLEAVRTKDIRAGLDVYCNQPEEKDCQWMPEVASHPNVITTHHIGASTTQAQLAVAEEVVRIVRVYRESGQFDNQVNKAAG